MVEDIVPDSSVADVDEPDIDDAEIEMLLASMGQHAFPRRKMITAAAGPPLQEQLVDDRPEPHRTAERLDRFRASLSPMLRAGHDLRDARFHSVIDGLDMTIDGMFDVASAPEPRDLLHVYGADRDNTGERRYYKYAWLDHGGYSSTFTTSSQAIIRSGRLAGACGVYEGQWGYSLGGAGMLFIADHGAARVSVRPYLPWVALTSFNHDTVNASVRCSLGILVQSWRPGDAQTVQEVDHVVRVVGRSSSEGYLYDSETSGIGIPSSGLQTEFVAVPERRYGIYVYAWLETLGGAAGGSGPIGYSRIEIDASIPFVVAEETLL